ncbi:MAG: DNA-binding protein [Chitinophagaceae bacterium]|nr:DNA-binding protein [Rubrivivax sp.]
MTHAAPRRAGPPCPATGAAHPSALEGDVEVLTLCGSVGVAGAHLHLSVAGADGQVLGGHAGCGCIVRTTAELMLLLLPGWDFGREPDAATGFDELVARPRAVSQPVG